MEMYDYLAWVILGVFYIFVGVPCVGSCATGHFSHYKEDWKAGAMIHLVLGVFTLILFGVLWAFIRVTGS